MKLARTYDGFHRPIITCARALLRQPDFRLFRAVSTRVPARTRTSFRPPTSNTGLRKQAKYLARKHLEKNDELRRL